MSTASPTPATSPALGGKSLAGLPRSPLSPSQQLEAIRRAQDQAEQRIKLGLRLFQAAEAHTANQQELLAQVKTAQEKLREQVNEDIARSLHAYDQWVAKIDDDFTTALENLQKRIDGLQTQWQSTQKRIEDMMRRSEAMLDQSRVLMESTHSAPSPGEAALVSEEGTGDTPDPEVSVDATTLVIKPAGESPDRLYRDILVRMNNGKKKQAG